MSSTDETVVDVARERTGREQEGDGVITLSSGKKARIRPVAASLIDEVTSRIKDPEVPTWHDPDKGRDIENYADPGYAKGLEEAQRKRGVAAMDTMIMFGVELVDGVPEDKSWIRQLKMIGVEVDPDSDDIELEFFYKKYVAVSSKDIRKVSKLSGLSSEEVDQAAETFRSS